MAPAENLARESMSCPVALMPFDRLLSTGSALREGGTIRATQWGRCQRVRPGPARLRGGQLGWPPRDGSSCPPADPLSQPPPAQHRDRQRRSQHGPLATSKIPPPRTGSETPAPVLKRGLGQDGGRCAFGAPVTVEQGCHQIGVCLG